MNLHSNSRRLASGLAGNYVDFCKFGIAFREFLKGVYH